MEVYLFQKNYLNVFIIGEEAIVDEKDENSLYDWSCK